MEGLWKKSATEITGLVKSREVSAVEVTQSAFKRLQAVNGKLNAVVMLPAPNIMPFENPAQIPLVTPAARETSSEPAYFCA